MQCPDCGSGLGAKAIKCRCGWSAAASVAPRPRVSCCYSSCLNEALVRVWTKTGWANVCEPHFITTESLPRRSESDAVREIREGYEKSQAFERSAFHKLLKAA